MPADRRGRITGPSSRRGAASFSRSTISTRSEENRPMTAAPTLASLSKDLESGRTSSRALAEACLAAIEAEDGEGARAFLQVDREAALAQADAMDRLRASGAAPDRKSTRLNSSH